MHFYYIFKPFEYLFEKQLISFIPATDLDKIDSMIKNLEEEVKFIHENKFRQIFNTESKTCSVLKFSE